MATLTARNPLWVESATRSVLPVEERLVDGAATWKAGQFLFMQNDDGLLYTCGDDPSAIHYYALQDLDSAIGNDTTARRVARVHDDDVWEMNVYHSTSASALIAEADVGSYYSLLVSNDNICYLDVEDKGTDVFVVVKPKWRDSELLESSGDVYGRVFASVLNSVCNYEA